MFLAVDISACRHEGDEQCVYGEMWMEGVVSVCLCI